jgi:outer membrane lipoprotein-sorting protein
MIGMKLRIKSILLWVMVMTVMVMLVGCGGTESASDESGPMTDKKAEQPAEELSMVDLADKFSSVPGIYFETELEASEVGELSNAKFWIKGKSMRNEIESPDGSGTLITIINQQEAYMIMGGNMAMRIDMVQATQGVTEPGDYYEDVDFAQAQLVGREKVDGKDCAVFEMNDGSENLKYWIWEAYGFPVKMEITAAGNTTTVEYKNVKVEDIPDSMFELPAGVEVMDMTEMMLNIPQP